jgi:hypothetical protein
MRDSRDVSLVPLILLADVHDDRLLRLDQLPGLRCVDLRDFGARLLEQLAVVRHFFPKYSDAALS